MKASLGIADNAERVFMRVQPHVLTIVPKDKATDFAKVLKRAPIAPRVRQGEALRLTVKDPWKQISIPNLKFSQSLKEIRLWIVPRASDGGADVYVEGDCTDEEAATDVRRRADRPHQAAEQPRGSRGDARAPQQREGHRRRHAHQVDSSA